MSKAAFFFVFALLLALTVPLCVAKALQEPETDEFTTTTPSEKLTIEAAPGVLAFGGHGSCHPYYWEGP